jgi:chaperonin GroES
MGATLALIEQGLQVFSTIYTRIYRSMRRELRLMNRLNGMHLNPEVYLKFQDSEELMQLMQGGYDPRMEFDLQGMDIVPSADPKSVTDMQMMMRAQYMGQFLGQPGINNAEIQKYQMEAAGIPKVERFFSEGPDPAAQMAAEKEKHTTNLEKAKVIKTVNEAEKIRQETENAALERGAKVGMAGGMGGMAGAADDPNVLPMPQQNGAGPAPAMGGPV